MDYYLSLVININIFMLIGISQRMNLLFLIAIMFITLARTDQNVGEKINLILFISGFKNRFVHILMIKKK